MQDIQTLELNSIVANIIEQLDILHIHLMNIDSASCRIKMQPPTDTELCAPEQQQEANLFGALKVIEERIGRFNKLASTTEKHLSSLI